MLDCVIYARDKWLIHNGIVTLLQLSFIYQLFPDKFTLKMAGCEDSNLIYEKQEFWDNIYGIKMPSIKEWVLHEPVVDVVPEK